MTSIDDPDEERPEPRERRAVVADAPSSLVGLFDTLDWDPAFDHKAERSRPEPGHQPE